jgi:hypothetical protein
VQRVLASSALVVAALVVVVPGAHARVEGPKTVRPGKQVTFRVTDMQPDAVMTVRLQRVPCGHVRYGCGGRALYGNRSEDGAYRSDADGTSTITFRWPKLYSRCVSTGSPHTCRYRKWRRGERVRFSVCDYSHVGPCRARVVRIR